jgi:hypothetical protein
MNRKIISDLFQKQLKLCICGIIAAGITVVPVKPVLGDEIIESEHQAVLMKKPDKIVSAGFWIPTKQQTNEALRAVNRYLSKLSKVNKEAMPVTTQNRTAPTKLQISKMHELLWKYRVQYMGINFDNRKVIYCNFFMYDRKKHAKWKDEYVDVSTGGSEYWQIDYDINSKQCTDLTINNKN